jgi:arylsulfatase A-like enzyme
MIPVLRFALLCAAASGLAAAAPPNLIFILSDDLAQGDLGVYGQKIIQTPRLDRMAAEGTRFTQTYCGTSVCAPSRASLMTGLHSGHCPVRGNWEIAPEGQKPLPAETVTVAEILKSAGYATGCTGKWGMGFFDTSGSPFKQGFDRFFGYNCQRHAHSFFPTYLWDNERRIDLPGNDGKTVGKTYAQELIQQSALDFVRSHKEKPFFLFYAITLPHGRHEIDELGRYADKPWSLEEKSYAAQVSRIDSDVGELLDLLKELAIDDNTLVIITGDNGSSFAPESKIGKRFNQAANGLRGFKRGLYEGALRQACIARWPGTVPAGRVSDEPWAFWDFLPTAAQLAGAAVPAECKTDGLSLVAHLKGGPAPKRESFYWELHEGKPIQAVRFGDWKAVKNGPKAEIELYDLAKDPGEKTNLAADKPELVQQAVALMKAHHSPSPDWPLDGVAPQRLADRNQPAPKPQR